MKINNIKLLTLGLCVLLGTPFISEASSAVRLSDTTFLFTIDFSIDEPQFDYEIPVAAKSGVTYRDRVDYLGYTVNSKKKTDATIIETNALVLSKNPLEGVRYQVPQGDSGDFTLFILATFNQKVEDNSLQAMITKFPYFIDGRRTTVHQNQLDTMFSPEVVVE